jgi:hypothetical protein
MYLLEAYLLNRPKVKKNSSVKSKSSALNTKKMQVANDAVDKRHRKCSNQNNKVLTRTMSYTGLEHETNHPISCLVLQINRHHKAMNKKSNVKVKSTAKSIALSA